MGDENEKNNLAVVVYDPNQYKPLYKEEEPLQQEQQRAAAPIEAAPIEAAPVAVQRQADPLAENIHRLHDEEFVELNVPLVAHADPLRDQISAQRQTAQARRSSKKAAKKNAEKYRQLMEDKTYDQLQQRSRALMGMDISSDQLIERTMLEFELGDYQRLPKRVDIDGETRRKNTKWYRKSASGKLAMRSAQKDVENLYNNLRRDICLTGNTDIEDDQFQEYADAYYFTRKYGEKVLREKKLGAQAPEVVLVHGSEKKIEEGRKDRAEKLEQFLLIQKSYATNFMPSLVKMRNELKAWKLARKTVEDESGQPSAYRQQMLQIINQKINEVEETYNNKRKDMRTYNGTEKSPRSRAQTQAQAELALLRREMKDLAEDDPKREELEQRGRKVFENYTYLGPVIKSK